MPLSGQRQWAIKLEKSKNLTVTMSATMTSNNVVKWWGWWWRTRISCLVCKSFFEFNNLYKYVVRIKFVWLIWISNGVSHFLPITSWRAQRLCNFLACDTQTAKCQSLFDGNFCRFVHHYWRASARKRSE